MLRFACPKCGQEFEAEDNFVGTKVKCSECGTRFFVPENGAAAVFALPKPVIDHDNSQSASVESPRQTEGIDVDKESMSSQNSETRQNGFRCPHCNTELEDGASFCRSCGAELGEASGGSSHDAPLTGPWARWISRMIDYTLELFAFAFLLGFFFNLDGLPDAVIGIICTPLAFLLDSAIYAVFGNTLGKWLWGIKVVENNGIKISASRYFNRNLRIYWGGYGLGIPIVTLCTFIKQYSRVSKGNSATYDEKMGVKSICPKPNDVKTFFGIIFIILVHILLYSSETVSFKQRVEEPSVTASASRSSSSPSSRGQNGEYANAEAEYDRIVSELAGRNRKLADVLNAYDAVKLLVQLGAYSGKLSPADVFSLNRKMAELELAIEQEKAALAQLNARKEELRIRYGF